MHAKLKSWPELLLVSFQITELVIFFLRSVTAFGVHTYVTWTKRKRKKGREIKGEGENKYGHRERTGEKMKSRKGSRDKKEKEEKNGTGRYQLVTLQASDFPVALDF